MNTSSLVYEKVEKVSLGSLILTNAYEKFLIIQNEDCYELLNIETNTIFAVDQNSSCKLFTSLEDIEDYFISAGKSIKVYGPDELELGVNVSCG